MKVRLTIEAEIDEEGLADYYRTYPGLADLKETPAEMLVREMTATCDMDGTIKGEARIISQEEIE